MQTLIDDGIINPKDCYLLQFFIASKNVDPSIKGISANDMLPVEYDPLKDATEWATGRNKILRMFLKRKKTNFVKQIQDYKSAIFTMMSVSSFMFVAHKPRREFYVYYTMPYIKSDLDFCDHGYHYFEIDTELISDEDVAGIISVLTTIKRSETSDVPIITAGELSKVCGEYSFHKIKLMPEVPLSIFDGLEEQTGLPFNTFLAGKKERQ